MSNYKELNDKLLTARNIDDGKPMGNNTRLVRDGKNLAIRLHSTNVVTITPKNTIILNTGGWLTKTTKDRMGSYARIGSIKGIWHIMDKNYKPISLYYDGIKINSKGKVISKIVNPDKKMNEVNKLKKRIKAYADGYAKMITDGKLEFPSAGDCMICRGLPLGDGDHLESHMEENYFVPSLLVNAIASSGYNPGVWFQLIQSGKDGKSAKRFIYKYLVKKLVK